jgi:pimeloyl-ACP methyl ester carboxylesterase
MPGPRPTVLALAAAAFLLVPGCADDDTSGPDTTSPSRPVATSAAPDDPTTSPPASSVPPEDEDPAVLADGDAWSDCGAGVECATLAVPIDHDDPDGATLDLAVVRVPASGGDDDRLGVIAVNPGGPGGSGVDLLLSGFALPDDLAERFDLVSWDPRGVGASEPVRCGGEPLDRWITTDPSPDDAAEMDDLEAAARALAEECGAVDGDLLDHLSTTDTVEDLDLLRAALGEEQLSYLGLSYGTFIGQLYLDAHPDRVRAMVLDGVVDSAADLAAMAEAQAGGFEDALGRFDAWCGEVGCPADPIETFEALSVEVEEQPVESSLGPVGPAELQIGTAAALYSSDAWPLLADALDQAASGDATQLADLAFGYYASAHFPAYAAVICSDFRPPDLAGFHELADHLATYEHFGIGLAYELLPCAFWPAPAIREPAGVEAPRGAPTVLLVGSVGDAATPITGARAVAERLDGRLLEVDSDSHTAFSGNGCVQDWATAYFVDGDLPPPGTGCPG